MGRSKILIVDQEKILSDLLVDVFPADSFEIFNASTSDQARRLADQHAFDLAIVDPCLPHGFQFIHFLRSKETTKVIALTNSNVVLEKARMQGMEQVVDKNDGLNRLVVAIRNLGFNVTAPGMEKAGILVVDDTPDIRDLITFFLRDRGYVEIVKSPIAPGNLAHLTTF